MFDGPWETCMLVRGLSQSECASWVQAWGSIFAIVAAVGVVVLAHCLQQKAKRREEFANQTRFLEGFFQLVCAVCNTAGKICEREGDEIGSSVHERRTMLAELQSLQAALSRIDLTRLDHFEHVEAWLTTDTFIRKLSSAVVGVDARSDLVEASGDAGQRNLRFARSELLDAARDAQKKLGSQILMLKKVIDARGGPLSKAVNEPEADAID